MLSSFSYMSIFHNITEVEVGSFWFTTFPYNNKGEFIRTKVEVVWRSNKMDVYGKVYAEKKLERKINYAYVMIMTIRKK